MKKSKILALVCTATMIITALTGCGSQSSGQTADVSAPDTEAAPAKGAAEEATAEVIADLAGSITMAGSTSMEKLANAVAESFMAKYPAVTVTAEFTGSSAGIESLLSGSVDIGNSSRALKDAETEAGAVENIVAIDGIAVVVDSANTVKGLTKDQLVQVFTGAITNWVDLGGANQPIVVVGREAGSGTRSAFEELIKVEDGCAYANELDSTGAVIAKVAATPGAIGYASLDAVDVTVTPLALDGVEATVENIKAGNYFLSRPFVMATAGAISEQSDAVKALFAYLASEEGKAVIKTVGLITVD